MSGGRVFIEAEASDPGRLNNGAVEPDEGRSIYRRMMELSPEAMILHREGLVIEANRVAAVMLSVEPASGLAGRSIFNFLPQDLRDQMAAAWASGADPSIAELEIPGPGGETMSVEMRTAPIILDRQPALLSIFRDITTQRRLEAAVADKASQYKQLLENISEGAFVIQDRKIVFANGRVGSLAGSCWRETSSRDYLELIHPEDRQKVIEYREESIKEAVPKPPLSIRIMSVNGETRLIEARFGGFLNWEGRPATLIFFQDVTDRNAARRALLESEMRYRAIFEHSSDGIAIFEKLEGRGLPRLIDCNESYARLAGRSQAELLATTDVRRLQLRCSAPENSLESQPGLEGVFSWQRPDGQENYVEYRAVPIEISGRRLYLGIDRDVTARILADRLLRAQRDLGLALGAVYKLERALDMLLEAALKVGGIGGGGVYLLDSQDCPELAAAKGLPEWFTAAASRFDPGPAAGVLIGSTQPYYGAYPEEFPAPPDVEGLKEARSLAILPIRDNDQPVASLVLWSSVHESWPEPSKDALEFLASRVGDAISRLRAERALRESEEKFSKTFKASPDGIIIIRFSDGLVLDFNEGFTRILGFRPEEAVGRTVDELNVWMDHSQRGLFTRDLLEAGQYIGLEAEFRARDGRIVPGQVSARTIEIGGDICAIAIIRDITQQKWAEKQLLEYQKQLRRLASELVAAESRHRSRIAEDLHDRIGQSLFLIKMKLDFRTRPDKAPSKKVLDEALDLLDQAVADVRTMIVEICPPSLNLLGLEAALSELADKIGLEYGLNVYFRECGDLDPLSTEIRDLLYRGGRELVFNVVKHAQATALWLVVRQDEEYIHVEVRDNGVGFDETIVDSALGESAGFGLFSLRERLQPIGGLLVVDSEPGQGARVVIQVPRARAAV